MNRKLGRKHGVIHDRRTLRLAAYVSRRALSERPASAATTRKITEWDALGNTVYGDCGPAAVYHADMAWDARLRRESAAPPPLADVLALYHAANPAFDPDTGDGDEGVYTLELLKAWRRGIRDYGELERLGAFASVAPTDHARMEFASANLGGLIVGMLLPESAQDTSKPWRIPSQPGPEDAIGSWGGHLVYLNAYDSRRRLFDLVTWGQVQKASYEWLALYADEAYCLFSPEWLTRSGRTPRGFNVDQLRADLAAL